MQTNSRAIKSFSIISVFLSVFLMIGSMMLVFNGSKDLLLTKNPSIDTIKIIETKLQSMGLFKGKVDGKFDDDLKQSLLTYQKNNNINPTGKLDVVTAASLGVSSSSQANSDLYLLAKLVYSEARGEPYTGQVAVAAVCLNRVASPDFPNTISGVIYQPWAFTALHDGQFQLEPNETAYQAAQDALNGWDPTYGSIYYYNPKTATSQWIFSRETVVQIGQHVFAR